MHTSSTENYKYADIMVTKWALSNLAAWWWLQWLATLPW